MVAPDDAFEVLSAVVPVTGSDDFTAHCPDHWQQGRGLYGGLVTALLVRALEAAAPGRALRSLTSELCGPVQPGPARLRVESLRVGSGMSTLAVRLDQGGEVLAHAVGVLGEPRGRTEDTMALPAVSPPPWDALELLPVGPPLGPVFAPFFEYRSASLPFSGGPPVVEGWIRMKNPGAARDAAFLAGCIDAYWPTEYILFTAPRPMATVAFTFQPLGDCVGLDPQAPLWFRAKLGASRDGFAVEFRELWGHDGRLLALNQQTICTIK